MIEFTFFYFISYLLLFRRFFFQPSINLSIDTEFVLTGMLTHLPFFPPPPASKFQDSLINAMVSKQRRRLCSVIKAARMLGFSQIARESKLYPDDCVSNQNIQPPREGLR